MNLAKNMEAIILTVLAMIMATGVANATVPVKHHYAPVTIQVGADANVAVITVSAKRLTAEQKAALAD